MSAHDRYSGGKVGTPLAAAQPRESDRAEAKSTQKEVTHPEEQGIKVHHPAVASWPEPLRRFHRHYADDLQAKHEIGRKDAEQAALIHMVMGRAGPLPSIEVHQRADGTWPHVGLPCLVVWVPHGRQPTGSCGPCSECHREAMVMLVLRDGRSLCARCWRE